MNGKGNGQLIGMVGVSWLGTAANLAAEAKSILGALAAGASLVASCYAIAVARGRLKGKETREATGAKVTRAGTEAKNQSESRAFGFGEEGEMATPQSRGGQRGRSERGAGRETMKANRSKRRERSRRLEGRLLAGVVVACFFLGQGCTFHRGKVEKARVKLAAHEGRMAEESRALTTGLVDALQRAPATPATEMAKALATADQEIEGLPLKRLPVTAALSGDTNAVEAIDARVGAIESLRGEQARLAAALREREETLIEMGGKHEEERNRKVARWARWSIGGLGLAGALAAVFVFCPVALPLAGRLMGWAVGKVPSMAGALGVVGKDAFDAVVRGVGAAREEMKKRGSEELGMLDARLREATDRSHKELIEMRRASAKG